MLKGKTTNKTFVTSMTKILEDSELDKNSIKRHDFKTQTLINIAKNYKEQKDCKWYNYKEFCDLEKNIIKNNKKEIENGELEYFINDINSIENEENDDNSNNSSEVESQKK